MPNFKLIEINQANKSDFIDTIETQLKLKYESIIPGNYGRETSWGLLSLLENDMMDIYQILYVDDEFWSSAGGMIREIDGEKIYQAGFRGFSGQTSRVDWNERGTGTKSYSWQYIIDGQINRAIELNCTKVIISFNDHNIKLFKISKFHLRKLKHNFIPSKEMEIFNGVPQWLLTMSLK